MRRLVRPALLIAIGIPILAGGKMFMDRRDSGAAQAQATAPARAAILLAAPGVVEPFGEEREIASELIAIVRDVRVDENDAVTAGQILATLENNDQKARLASAEADLALRQAEQEKLRNGARAEERRAARAALVEADASVVLAVKEHERTTALAQRGNASPAVVDQTKAGLDRARARRSATAENLALVEAPPRREDVAAADARVRQAEAQVELARAALEKTFIRSPIDGVVLRRYRIAGEAVGNQPPTPIFAVGDVRRLRVRAEVDETAIGRLKTGQRIEATADGFPGQRYAGTVIRIAKRIGAKTVMTGRTSDKQDTKVLQVLIDLDPGAELPVGLRLDVFFAGNS